MLSSNDLHELERLEKKLEKAVEALTLIAHNGYEDSEMKVDIIPEQVAQEVLKELKGE